nr:monovalent cation/H(+) antiporter subunit G [uncultured Brevundimonas sp.]
MTAADLPLWAAILIVVLAILGAGLSLLGTIGLTTFKTFYERVHAPTLGATLGMVLVLLASTVFFTMIDGRFMPREILIGLFLTVTTPVTLTLLARAAIFRDRTEGKKKAALATKTSSGLIPSKEVER